MTAPMRISLRAGERFYVNGAVLRVERKTTLELLNNANFLLENHIMQAEDATTPLRQVYFALQTLLMEPGSKFSRDAYGRIYSSTLESFSTTDVVAGLRLIGRLVEAGRIYEALKTLRSLFAVEATILEPNTFAARPKAMQESHDGREQHHTDDQHDAPDLLRSHGLKYG